MNTHTIERNTRKNITALDKQFVIGLIFECDRMGYIALRNDLIEDIKHQLNDWELSFVMGLVDGTI